MKPAKRHASQKFPVVIELHKIRRKQSLRRDVLAEMMGYHWQTVGRWERGESTPSTQALHDWCQALGVEIQVSQGASR